MNLDFDPNRSLLNRPGLEAAIKKQESKEQDYKLKKSLFVPYEEYRDQESFSHEAKRSKQIARKVITIFVVIFVFFVIFRFVSGLF